MLFARWIQGAVVCAVAGLALVAQAGPLLDKVKSEGRLTLAHRDASIPFSYLDANGKPIGYAIDICRQMAKAIQQALGLSQLPLTSCRSARPIGWTRWRSSIWQYG